MIGPIQIVISTEPNETARSVAILCKSWHHFFPNATWQAPPLRRSARPSSCQRLALTDQTCQDARSRLEIVTEIDHWTSYHDLSIL